MGMNYYNPYLFQQKPQMMPYQNYYVYPQTQGNMPKPVFMPMYFPVGMNQMNNNFNNSKQNKQDKEKENPK